MTRAKTAPKDEATRADQPEPDLAPEAEPEEAAVTPPAPAVPSQPQGEPPMTATLTLLADPALDPNKMLLEGIDTSAGPLYSVSEMAKVFFARSSHWVRWLETCDYPVPDPARKGKTKPCQLHPHQHNEKLAAKHRDRWRLMFEGELLEPIRTASNARKYDLALIEKIVHCLASNGTIKPPQLRQALTIVKMQAEMHDYI